MSQTIDKKLRDMFHNWGEEPSADAWAAIERGRKRKAVPFQAVTTDDSLRDVFSNWGEEPDRNAWDRINHERSQRVLEKNRKRRRVLLAFFSGCLLMSILLLPFIVIRKEVVPAESVIAATAQEHNPVHHQAKGRGNDQNTNIPSKPSHAGNSHKKQNAEKGIHPAAHIPTNDAFTLFADNANAAGEDTYINIGLCSLKKSIHPYHVFLQTAGIARLYKPEARPGIPRFGLTMLMQLGYLDENSKLASQNNPGSAHKDAGANYGKWLTAAKTGFSISADINKTYMSSWIIQAGLTYRHSEQKVHYDYVYRDVPVFWKGSIAGYIHLNDTLATVYRTEQVNTSQNLNLSVGIGRQLIHRRRWKLAAFVHISPNLLNRSKGQLLNLNRNTFESISGLMLNKGIPYGVSARFTYRIGNGTEMFVQYSRSSSRESLSFSGADMVISTTGNKITLGFQYPLLKQ
jgi:predicted nucleic acid-binding Zn ribbon protein